MRTEKLFQARVYEGQDEKEAHGGRATVQRCGISWHELIVCIIADLTRQIYFRVRSGSGQGRWWERSSAEHRKFEPGRECIEQSKVQSKLYQQKNEYCYTTYVNILVQGYHQFGGGYIFDHGVGVDSPCMEYASLKSVSSLTIFASTCPSVLDV